MRTVTEIQRDIDKFREELKLAEKYEIAMEKINAILEACDIQMSIESNCRCDSPQFRFIHKGEEIVNWNTDFNNIE